MQLDEILGYTLLVLFFTWPAFVLSIILGTIILVKYKQDRLARMAGWFTLKPLLATPLWAILFSLKDAGYLEEQYFNLLSMVPAILLTLLILRRNRIAFTTDRILALFFLLVDFLRWLNTLLWQFFDGEMGIFYILGLVLPNLYALLAIILIWQRNRSQRRLEQAALDRLAP